MRIHIDGAYSALVLINHQDFQRSLENLKSERHVVCARHTRPVTLQFRVASVVAMRVVGGLHGRALFQVFFLLCQSLRFVRNDAALDYALPSGTRAPHPHNFGMRSGLRRMRLNVPIRCDESLPNAVEIRLAVYCPRRRVSMKQSGGGSLSGRRVCGYAQRNEHGATWSAVTARGYSLDCPL